MNSFSRLSVFYWTIHFHPAVGNPGHSRFSGVGAAGKPGTRAKEARRIRHNLFVRQQGNIHFMNRRLRAHVEGTQQPLLPSAAKGVNRDRLNGPPAGGLFAVGVPPGLASWICCAASRTIDRMYPDRIRVESQVIAGADRCGELIKAVIVPVERAARRSECFSFTSLR